MKTYADKTDKNKNQSFANETSQKQNRGESSLPFVDNRPEAVSQRRLQAMTNNSLQAAQLKALKGLAQNGPQAKQAVQFKAMTDHKAPLKQPQSLQKQANKTGFPDNLKSGIESLSGYSLDDVKVHYNSSKPAQLHAHAYAQGTDIHLGPGQEKHLPHEAWHVLQQKQGRVKPTVQMKAISI